MVSPFAGSPMLAAIHGSPFPPCPFTQRLCGMRVLVLLGAVRTSKPDQPGRGSPRRCARLFARACEEVAPVPSACNCSGPWAGVRDEMWLAFGPEVDLGRVVSCLASGAPDGGWSPGRSVDAPRRSRQPAAS